MVRAARPTPPHASLCTSHRARTRPPTAPPRRTEPSLWRSIEKRIGSSIETLDAFLGSSEQQVLLVSGAAGSAKAASSQEACRHVRGEYSAQRAKEGVRVVAIYAHLPSLRNPLTGLFREALQAAPYCMRDSQIDELREFIQDPDQKAEVVFLCDS